MYNSPVQGIDSLEYIEIYNNTTASIDLMSYSLIGVEHTFTETTVIESDDYLVLCKNTNALTDLFNISALQWSSGALNNDGEEVGIINIAGDTVFSITYGTSAPWPQIANGFGPSLELCADYGDVQDPSSWNLSPVAGSAIIINFFSLDGSPGAANRTNCQQRDYKQLAISEIFYEQPLWASDLQYVEFYNYGDKTINVSDWQLSGDYNMPLTANRQLAPGEHFLIGSDFQALAPFGIFLDLIVPPNFQIFGDPFFILENPDGEEVLKIEFDEELNFPVPNRGEAVELCDPFEDNNQGLNWGDDNSCTMQRTHTKDSELSQPIRILPNPCSSHFTIDSDTEINSFGLYDQLGHLILEGTETKNISVEEFATGIYYLKILVNNKPVIKRMVKK